MTTVTYADINLLRADASIVNMELDTLSLAYFLCGSSDLVAVSSHFQTLS